MYKKTFHILFLLILPVFIYGCGAKNAMEDYFYKIPTVKEINANTILYLNIIPGDENEKLILNNYNELSLAVIGETESYDKELFKYLDLEKKYNKIITDIYLKWRHNKEKALLSYDREEELFNRYLKIKSIEVFLDKSIKNWHDNFRNIKKTDKAVDFQVFSESNLMFLSLLFERNKLSFTKSITLIPKSLAVHNMEISDKEIEKDLKGLYSDERKIALELLPRLRILKKRLDKILYGIYCLEEFRNEIFKENIITLKSEILSYERKIKLSSKHKLLSENEIEINELQLEIFNIYLLSLENINRALNNQRKRKIAFNFIDLNDNKLVFDFVPPAYAESYYMDRLSLIKDTYISRPATFLMPKLNQKWINKLLIDRDINNMDKNIKNISDKIYLFVNHKDDYLSFSKNIFQDYRKAWFNRNIGIGTIYSDKNRTDIYDSVNKSGSKLNMKWTSCIFSYYIRQNLSIYNKIFKDCINKPSIQTREALKKAFLYSYFINISYLSSPKYTGGGEIFYNIGKQIKDVLVAKESLIVELYKKKVIHSEKMIDFIELMHGKGFQDLKRYQKIMSKSKEGFLDGKALKRTIKRIKEDTLSVVIKDASKSLKDDVVGLAKDLKNDPKYGKKLFIENTNKINHLNTNAIFNVIDLYSNITSKSLIGLDAKKNIRNKKSRKIKLKI